MTETKNDLDRMLGVLEARRLIYATKEEQCAGREFEPSYDREEVFGQKREAMEWAINEVCAEFGIPLRYTDD